MAFVDTSFLYALVDDDDTNHEEAGLLLGGLPHRRLTTTALVLGEAWTLMGHRHGHWHAARLIDRVRRSEMYEVVHVDSDAEGRSFEWLLRHDERHYSFVDATSFQVMWDRRIDTALSFDSDFDAAGFATLRA